MKKQAVRHGFALKETREISEIKATANLYEHVASGAKLLHLACEDNNKVFCVTFKTVPENNTGCPHILEHSVLNGSKNFPGKSTFQELIKGSLHTFINAMTSSDNTMYPVASTNQQDFLNLTRVYLDAVFFPKIHTEPNILHQEGWHYELPDAEADLKVRGVVYNEMKGAFSNPDAIISRQCQHAQFPDTPYGFESGGDPDAIPELSYKDFIAFYNKYYHPSNAYIFLYGDADADKVMEMVDADYLSHFKNGGGEVEIPLQKGFTKVKKMEVEYPVEEGKDTTGLYHLSFCYTYGRNPDLKTASALGVLMELLLLSTASPLKKAILESGLAKDTSASIETEILQPTLVITCKHVKKEDLAGLEKLVHGELKRLVGDGFDPKLVEAVINRKEFFLREGQMWGLPKGLFHAWTTYPHWIHGGNPLDALGFEDILKELRRGLTEKYFEGWLDKAMVKNKHASIITFVPVPGLVGQKDAELRDRLAAEKKKMTKTQLEKLVAFNQDFTSWQNEEVSAEDLAKIPMLSIQDIERKAASYPLEIEKYNAVTVLRHPLGTNGIVYLKGYFDLSHAEEEDLPWLALYAYLTGMVDSRNYGWADLANEIDIHTGGVHLQFALKNGYQDPDLILPKYIISGKAVSAKVDKLAELASELAFKPLFTDEARLKLLIREARARMESQILRQGSTIAVNRMFAPFSQIHRFTDLTQGLAYYHFLVDLEQRLDKEIATISADLGWVRDTFFTQNNMILSLTADDADINAALRTLRSTLLDVPNVPYEPIEQHFHPTDLNEGILAPMQIQFCAKGGNFFRKGYSYSGHLRVLNNVLSNDFLHREIREKGGAYGVWASFSLAGNMYFCSYRDPNLRETLDVYDRVPEYLHNFECSRREMEKYIIGEISSLDYPKTPEAMGAQSDDDFITGFTQEDRQQIRDEVLSTKVEDIRHYAEMIEDIMTKNHYCVFGNETKVKEAEDLFHRLTPVFT